MISKLLFCGGIAVALLLCLSMTPSQAGGADETAKQIREILETQRSAWNRGDLAGFMATYWKDERLTFYSGGNKTLGWQATFDRYKARYQGEGKEMGSLVFRDAEVDILGPEAALVRARWQLTFKDGKKIGGIFTVVCRKMPQGWCIVHDHTSQE